jgi:hypothetical protein
MLAATIIESLFSRGILIWADGDKLKVSPSSALTDQDRHLIRCYRSELLWRINHPEGDPDASGYQVRVITNGEESRVALDVLIAEGKEIIGDAQPKTPGLSRDLWAASVALARREGREKSAPPSPRDYRDDEEERDGGDD